MILNALRIDLALLIAAIRWFYCGIVLQRVPNLYLDWATLLYHYNYHKNIFLVAVDLIRVVRTLVKPSEKLKSHKNIVEWACSSFSAVVLAPPLSALTPPGPRSPTPCSTRTEQPTLSWQGWKLGPRFTTPPSARPSLPARLSQLSSIQSSPHSPCTPIGSSSPKTHTHQSKQTLHFQYSGAWLYFNRDTHHSKRPDDLKPIGLSRNYFPNQFFIALLVVG